MILAISGPLYLLDGGALNRHSLGAAILVELRFWQVVAVDTLRQALLVGHIDGSCTNAGLEKIAVVSAMSMMPRRSPRFAADRRLNLFDGAAAICPVAEGAQIVDIGITIFQQELAG